MTRITLIPCAIVASSLLIVGCSGNKMAPAKVSGSVSYNGKPLKAGTMKFVTPEGIEYPAQISPDGTYTATDIPEGELVVVVETETINPGNKNTAQGKDAERRNKVSTQQPPSGYSSAPSPAENYMKIPEKYNNSKTSPLAVTLSKGRQVQNIELVD